MTAYKHHQLMLAKINLDDIDQKIAPIEVSQKNLVVIVQKIVLDLKIQTNIQLVTN